MATDERGECMTDRDHFAAAALTGLLASREWPIDSDEAAHYCYRVADAMLRERERTNHDAAPAARASLPTADHAVCRGRGSGCGTGDTPAIDRLREWERHGSGRWGIGAAGDVTMLERRLAMVEAIVHDAAPAAITVSDEDRTDKAATSHRRDRSGEPPCLAKGQVPLGSESVAGTNSCRRPSQTGRFSDRIRQFFCSRT